MKKSRYLSLRENADTTRQASAPAADEAQFREDLGKLCKVLKDSLKGRTTESLIDLYAVVKESGLPEAFVKNAIDADLIGEILGRIGAEWLGDSYFIRVPPNFGLTPL